MATLRGDYGTNLLAHWKLEETSGTRYDAKGYNHLTDNNTVGSDTGVQGTCASFVAANSERLNVTADSVLSGQVGDFTVGFWKKFDSLPSSGSRQYDFMYADKIQFASAHNTSGTYYLYAYLRDAAGFYLNQVSWSPSTATWYYIAITREQSTGYVKFYVNGSQQGSTVESGRTADLRTETGLNIGGVTTAFTDGDIDEVSYWDTVLSGTDLTAIYNSGSGIPYLDESDIANSTVLSTSLVSHWEMEETSGTRTDSKNSNDFADNGTVDYTASGVQGNAADFDGSVPEFLNQTTAALEPQVGVSVGLWFKTSHSSSVTNGTMHLYTYQKAASPYDGLVIEMTMNGGADDGKVRFSCENSGGTKYTSGYSASALNDGSWHYLVASVTSDGVMRLYVDGVLEDASATFSGSFGTGYATTMGQNLLGGGNNVYTGFIDETSYWDRAVPLGEIQAIYNAGSGTPYDVGASGPASMKTLDTIATASVKTINGIAIASVKTINTIA